jgi:serine/threonine-protein kinase HipA
LKCEGRSSQHGPPARLQRIAGILQAVASPDSPERLLRAETVNALIGNGDAHAKNFSLLHHASGLLALTPLYDLMCTLRYGDDRLAMYIDDVHHTNRVTVERIANEAARWGMSRDRALVIITDLLERAPFAIAAARDETDGVPSDIISTVEGQLAQLRSAG